MCLYFTVENDFYELDFSTHFNSLSSKLAYYQLTG